MQGTETARLAKGSGARMAAEDQSGRLDAGKDPYDLARMQGVKAVERIEGDHASQVAPGMGRDIPGNRVEIGGLKVAVLAGQTERNLRRDEQHLVQTQRAGQAQRAVTTHRKAKRPGGEEAVADGL